MIQLKKSSEHSIDIIFILSLLTLFALTSFFVTSIGARQYQAIANQMSNNYETRTISAYLGEKINQSDSYGSVAITELGSVQALAMTQTVNEQIYTTYIYAYDGYLWEITVSSGTEVLPGSGQKIIETGAIFIEELSNNLFCFTITDTNGGTYPLYLSLNSK